MYFDGVLIDIVYSSTSDSRPLSLSLSDCLTVHMRHVENMPTCSCVMYVYVDTHIHTINHKRRPKFIYALLIAY